MRSTLLIFIGVLLAPAQGLPGFEVATVKRNRSHEVNTRIEISGGRLTITNASLKTLIRNSWDLLSFQFAGGPNWLDTDMFDIQATTSSPEKITTERLRPLLQSLLADRFALKVHLETRETNVFGLVPAKDGAKLKQNTSDIEPGINTSKFGKNGKMIGTREPVSILTTNLGNQLGSIVIDKTGLKGAYDWKLEWDPDPSPDSILPSLFTAVQEQLGLKLEAQKGPMQVLVIDSAERPSDN
jgi:uncharacterized protein (TIGR03435 family)